MYKFGIRSQNNLRDAHPLLVKVANEAIKTCDFTVICSYRGKEEQDAAFRAGKSRARFGQSPHNYKKSLAIDIVPHPLDWNDLAAFERMGFAFMSAADRLGVPIVWGRYFSTLVDYPHFELHNWNDYL